MKTLLMCYEGAALNREGLLMWPASFSDLVGVVISRDSLAPLPWTQNPLSF